MKVILEMRRCTLNLISMFLMVHYTTVTQTMDFVRGISSILFIVYFFSFTCQYLDPSWF
jgi:hypothetical protein